MGCAQREFDARPAVITSPSTVVIEGRSSAQNATAEEYQQAPAASWAARTNAVKVAKAIRQKALEKNEQFLWKERVGG